MNQHVVSKLHEQHLDWLTAKQAHQQKKLAVTEDLLAQDPDFDEVKDLVIQLQADVVYCETILEYLKKNFDQQSDCSESQYGFDDEDNNLAENENEDFVQDDWIQRDPMDMLYPKYNGMSMFEIIESILNDASEELSIEDVTKIAYDTQSENEFLRAKGSMSAQLRIGATKEKWAKVGRGYFASNAVVKQKKTSNKSNVLNFQTLAANNGY